MLYEITKVQKYGKGIYQSEKIGIQYYYIVNIRVFTDETKSRFYKLHFIMMFDGEDLAGYYDNNEPITDADVNEYKKLIAYSYADSICAYNNINDIARDCNYYIKRYDTYNLVKRYNV